MNSYFEYLEGKSRDGYIKEDYNCFDDYLIDQMNSTIENM